MEHQPQFSLTQALEAWQDGLRRTGQFSADDLAELRAHLLDSMDALKASGLSKPEAFLIASRRLGKAETLEQEFAKLSPAKPVPRETVMQLMGALGLLLLRYSVDFVLNQGFFFLMRQFFTSGHLDKAFAVFSFLVLVLTAGILVVLVRRGSQWQAWFFGWLQQFPFGVAAAFGLMILFTFFLADFGESYLSNYEAMKVERFGETFEYYAWFWIGFYGLVFLAFVYSVVGHVKPGNQSARAWLANAPAIWLVLGGCSVLLASLAGGRLAEEILAVGKTTWRGPICLGIASFILGAALAKSTRYALPGRMALAIGPAAAYLLFWLAVSVWAPEEVSHPLTPTRAILMLGISLASALIGHSLGTLPRQKMAEV